MLLSGIVMVVALLALGLALAWRSADQEQLQRGRRVNCKAIEEIKAALREDAAASYRNLARSLRILQIPKTPEIEEAAKTSRDERLARFAPSEC